MTILAILTYLPVKPIISIKIISIFFDYVIAFFSVLIFNEILRNQKNKTLISFGVFSIIILSPTLILNSSWWGQCDSIYVSFIIISIYFLIKGKYLKSFIFLGISFSFKLQFVFILPLYGLIYLTERKFPIYYFLIIPLVNLFMCLPAIAIGRPLMNSFSIYFGQTTVFNNFINMNFPGIYNILYKTNYEISCIISPNKYASWIGIIITSIGFIATSIIFVLKKYKYNNELILLTGILGVLFSTFFLPHMHDRYIFIADILSILYIIIYKRKFYMAIIINFISIYSYFVYMFRHKAI
jgi:Gpi18-like mannosyltransferase